MCDIGPWSPCVISWAATDRTSSSRPRRPRDGCPPGVKGIRRTSSGSGSASTVTSVELYSREDGAVRAHSDSDWAGCLKTHKSTSGGILWHRWVHDQTLVIDTKGHRLIVGRGRARCGHEGADKRGTSRPLSCGYRTPSGVVLAKIHGGRNLADTLTKLVPQMDLGAAHGYDRILGCSRGPPPIAWWCPRGGRDVHMSVLNSSLAPCHIASRFAHGATSVHRRKDRP